MTNENQIKKLAGKRIAETLEALEYGGMSEKEVGMVRKAMWRLFDELVLTKKVGSYDKYKQ